MFDYYHERRSAAVFYATIMVLLGLLLLAVYFYTMTDRGQTAQDWFVDKSSGSIRVWPAIFLGVGVVLAGAFISYLVFKLWRKEGSGRYQSTPLSQDEWSKARRKLAAKPTAIKR